MNSAIKDVSINFPDEGLCTGCEVEDLGGNKYMLREHPLMAGSAKYGDVIEAIAESPGQIRFVKVVEKSRATMHEYILSKDIIASEPFKLFKKQLSDKGIFWQNDFGGIFICFTKPDSEIDIAYEISKFT
jgi:hypothetical protein